jgi:hypothetical protein
MAKYSKRKKATRKPSRRRRIGAAALNLNSPLVKFGSIAVGYLMAGTINTMLDKVIPTTIDQKLVAGGEVGLGALLAFKKQKSTITTVGGGILIGAGIKRAVSAFGVAGIGGYQSVPVVGRIGRYQDVPVINGGFKTQATAMAGYKTQAASLMG